MTSQFTIFAKTPCSLVCFNMMLLFNKIFLLYTELTLTLFKASLKKTFSVELFIGFSSQNQGMGIWPPGRSHTACQSTWICDLALAPDSSLLIMQILGGSSVGSNNQDFATHMADLCPITAFQFQPGPAPIVTDTWGIVGSVSPPFPKKLWYFRRVISSEADVLPTLTHLGSCWKRKS